MGGLAAFKRTLAFLVAQIVLLLACAVYLAFEFVSFSGQPGLAVALAPALVFAAIALMVLWLAWSMGINGVELFWGTSVKLLVERWMQPALVLGSLSMIAAASLLAFAEATLLARSIEAALAALAIGGPLAISLALAYSAARRFRAYNLGHELMAANGSANIALERVGASIASEQGSSETTVRPDPQGFTFAGLTSKPWHDPADFPWVAAFVEAVDEITEEFLELEARHSQDIQAYSYAGLEGEFWKSFQFATRHREIPENIALCPKTASLLRTIPHYPSFRDAMFSILDGGGIIRPHRDVSNVFLTMHLPLIAPGNGFMEVGGLKREWREGQPIVFDSSYQHQAQNNSDQRRVVLLIDFLHPDLTDEEAAWVSASKL